MMLNVSSVLSNVHQVRYDGDKMIVTVQHHGQATTLCKLSGIRFAGGKVPFNMITD